jgi:predicted transcriptional regulator
MGKDRDESGKFTEVVSDDEIITFLQETEGASTAEVADHFEYERPTAYRRLKDLEDNDQVESREIGNSLLWLASRSD